ncbi:MAG: MFS transporter [Ilumatobacteraceae bacterium]|jgi:MFS family permease|nr:MFS transporter [Actinomycetes bacterium]
MNPADTPATSTRLPSAFWRQFAASTTSNLGDGLVGAAAPLLALSLTNDSRMISAVSFAAMLPWLVLSLPAGVFIDRHDRQRIMTGANLIRAALFGVLALSIVTDVVTIWMLLLLVLLLAVCEVLFDMSAQAFLPAIVDDHLLEKANGRLYAAEVAANSFVGLPIGAWLFVIAAAAPFGLQAVALTLAALLLASITIARPFVKNPVSSSYRESFASGFSWLWRHPLLRTLALMLGAANMCHMFAQSVFAKYVRDELGLGPRGFGLLLATAAVGSILGGLVGSRIAKWLGPSVAIVVSYSMFAALEIIPAVLPEVWAVVGAGALMAVFGTVWNVITVSLRQRLIPQELFGRVNSVYRFIGTGTSALGAVLGGQIAFYFGLRATYVVSAVLLGVVLIVGAPQLLRHARTHMAPERTPAPPSIT